ncbi:hypothetical protein ABZU86_02780 [Streptomyces sp. NPDC005271]|uniref:hypothetical protein n=1 Tax=unclassified Streptomyces TaxID=2593676 RepID=UPI0033AE5BCA
MKMIQPQNIPQFTGDLPRLETEAESLGMDASHLRAAGQGMHDRFQGLSAYYHAPEADQLFATTLPVRDTADEAASDVESIGRTLESYAAEVRPIAAKLARLKRQATQFVEDVGDDDDWAYDRDKVSEHQDLLHDVNAAVSAFWEAERRAANQITALFGGPHYVVNDGSKKPNAYGYGYKGSDLDHAKKTPWGSPVELKYHPYDIGHYFKSFVWDGFIVDGVWGTLKGLGTLAGFNGWDEAKAAWKNLGSLGVGAGVYMSPTLRNKPESELPPFLRESKHTAKEAGKSLVAWDEWGKNPARAAGAVSFNVVTGIGTGGAGTAAKSGALSKAISTAGKIGRLADPMTYVFKGVGLAKVKVADVLSGLKNAYSGRLLELADGSVKLPNNAVFHPDGSVKLPSGHYLDEYGTLYKADGTVLDRARVELSAADRQALDDIQRARQTVPAHPGGEDATDVARAETERRPQANHEPAVSPRSDPPGTGARGAPAQDGHGSPTQGTHDAPGAAPHQPLPSDGSHPPGGDLPDGSADLPVHSGHETPHSGDSTDRVAGSSPGGAEHGHTGNDDVARSSTGGMHPQQEGGVATELTRMKLAPADQERLLTQLRKSPYGSGVADLVSRGHLSDVANYDEVLKMCKQKDMIPAAHMALEHATDLQSRGLRANELAFEIKNDATGLDLDVATLKPDGVPDYGYQLKDVQNVEGINSAARKAAKQLAGEGAVHKVAILDIHQPMAAFDAELAKKVEFLAGKSSATYYLRFDDGSVIIPDNGRVFP